ncbi:unnamed protein product [Brugia pahangi]|uniref:Uncharacterized protein n=1 Tax=Brugia pahangi TaxID=6280 RepID=A0A0N4TTI7_BRUPA|nr:unnamed protein product [Brugia pahangi]
MKKDELKKKDLHQLINFPTYSYFFPFFKIELSRVMMSLQKTNWNESRMTTITVAIASAAATTTTTTATAAATTTTTTATATATT